MRWLFFNVFVHPRLKLKRAAAAVMQLGIYTLLRKTGVMKILPPQLRKMEQMLPAKGPCGRGPCRSADPARHSRENSWVLRRLRRVRDVRRRQPHGGRTIVRGRRRCHCALHGSLLWRHSPPQRLSVRPCGDLARRNIDAFLPETGPPVDFIATNIAGCAPCSASTTFYCETTRDTAPEPEISGQGRVRDVSEVLLELGLPEMKHPVNETVTYHDACHLAHAQKVTAEPRAARPDSA